jgi:uncharacterized protein (DUF305 family)
MARPRWTRAAPRARRGSACLFIAACLAVALAACGADEPSQPGAAPKPATPAAGRGSTQLFNATDVMFAQMMVPLHGQGVEIVRLARTHATRPEVKNLAAAIEVTQLDEIATMARWLREWGQPATADANAHAEHGGMPGTSAADIARLGKTSGADFERDFLNMLIAHQDDAIQVARMETAQGVNPEATALADRIQKSRAAQIKQMLALLGQH